MFHAFDNHGAQIPLSRPLWMAELARAPMEILESALAGHASQPPRWLRAPETGLMMVQGRAGGTGERFNLGEVTVTRCALRLAADPANDTAKPSAVGVAYVLGRSHRRAQLAAVADALLQDPDRQGALENALLLPVRQHLAALRSQRHVRAQASKVDFFTVARESSGDDADEGDGI